MIKIYFVNIRTQLLSEVFMVLKLYATLLMYTNIDMLAREIPRGPKPVSRNQHQDQDQTIPGVSDLSVPVQHTTRKTVIPDDIADYL